MRLPVFAQSTIRCLLAVLHCVLVGTFVEAADGPLATVDDIRAVHAAALELAAKHGPANVLVAVDIDNTLLAMDQDLGSDQWFDWQQKLQQSDPQSRLLVARKFDGLLQVQGLLYGLGSMHPPQPDAPHLIADLQDRGLTVIVITSRGPDFRAATERELASNGFDFTRRPLAVDSPSNAPYRPYELNRLSAAGLSPLEARRFDLGPPRDVTYADGILMVAGQHKGAMLLTLLARCSHAYHAVVFVDDHQRHVERVVDACQGRGLVVRGFRYSREDDRVRLFAESDKTEVTCKWRKLRDTLEEVFGDNRREVGPVRKAG